MTELKPGDPAPDFELLDQQGHSVRLSGLRGKKILLYFYPEADTSGCTIQSCEVRDAHDELEAQGVRPIGVSPDAPDEQRRFDDKYGLGFTLLSDPHHAVAEAYGAWGDKTSYGRSYQGIIRSSFLIDEDGRIERAWYKVKPKETVPEAVGALGA